jgi:hypothetical protein
VRLRDAQVLGLAAGHLAVQLRVAEQRGALVLVAHLGGLALRVELLVAHPAVAAGDVERDHHAVARPDVRHLGADLLDDPHRLVAEDVARVDEHAEHLVEVEVGAADRGRGDADDRVGRFPDRRIGHLLDADVALAVERQRLHALPLVVVGGNGGALPAAPRRRSRPVPALTPRRFAAAPARVAIRAGSPCCCSASSSACPGPVR